MNLNDVMTDISDLTTEQKDFCKKYEISPEEYLGSVKINSDLNLGRVRSLPEGFSPDVSGNLDLSCLVTMPKGFNPKVGGDLLLSSLKSIPEEFDLKRVNGTTKFSYFDFA